jgi:hypothetical protein
MFPNVFADTISPNGPAQEQTITRKVTGADGRIGGVYWYQLDNGDFRVDINGGQMDVPLAGTEDDAYPTAKALEFSFDTSNWIPPTYKDTVTNTFYTASQVTNVVKTASYDAGYTNPANSYSSSGTPYFSGNKVIVNVTTGYGYNESDHTIFMTRPNGKPKFLVMYKVPLNVTYTAEIQESKKINLTGLSTLAVNVPQQYTAQIDTKNFGSSSYTLSSDVSNRPETSWTSSNTSVANVSAAGIVTGLAAGTTTLRATWKSGAYELTDTMVVTVTASATPTPTAETEVPTPTQTPAPTPTPPPTCGTPPTANMISPGTAKQGEDFYVSGFGSKQANGGANLSYQWYYYPYPSGPVSTGPSTQNATLNILSQGTYYIVLGVTDQNDTICSAQASRTIIIKPPGPDADVTVRGNLKIKRPMMLDGSSSSSPSAYPISDSSRQFSITYPSGVTAPDCVILDSLNGTKTARMMCKKPGDYKVSYSVTNSLGLSSTKTTPFTVADDLRPIGGLQGPSVIYRDPNISNKASIPLTFTFTSPDNDTISSTVIGAIADANNDGYFVDDVNNSIPATFDLITGTATVTANTVGHVRNIISGCETFDPGDFASYITTSDYLCSAGYLDVTVDNQAPTMNVGASKKYKTDIFVNIGAVPTADQSYLLNNIQNLKAALGALQVDAKITASKWDTNVEQDFLKDSNTKLNHDILWRNPLDQKYFVGYTNNLVQAGSLGAPLELLNLKTIPAFNTTAVTWGTGQTVFDPKGGRNVYVTNTNYTNPSYNDQWDKELYYASNGTGYKVANMGHQDHGASYPVSDGYVQFDTHNNWYVISYGEPSGSPDPFRSTYNVYGGFGGGNFKGWYDHNQIFSKPSLIKGEWTVWSTAGIFYFSTWQQTEEYFRKASNNWIPTVYPDLRNGGNSPDVYTEGYTIGNDVYWFGYQGYLNSHSYFDMYLTMRYNDSVRSYSNYNSHIYDKQLLSDGMAIIVHERTTPDFVKLTFKNGNLVSQDKLTGIPNNGYPKFNMNLNKALQITQVSIDNKTRFKVSEYNMTTKTIAWTKYAGEGIRILDVSWDTDGSPLFLFKNKLSETPFISKDNDSTLSNTTIMQKVSTADKTVSYNKNGSYSWIEDDNVNRVDYSLWNGGTLQLRDKIYKIIKVDSSGKMTVKSFPVVTGTVLLGNHTYEDDSVVIFGVNAISGKLFYALETEDYTPHNLQNYRTSTTANDYYNERVIQGEDDDDTPYLVLNSNKAYKFDRTAGTLTVMSGNYMRGNPDGSMGNYIRNQTLVNITSNVWSTCQYCGKYIAYNLGGFETIRTYHSNMRDNGGGTQVEYTPQIYSSDLDFDSQGYVAGIVSIQIYGGGVFTYFNTNRPEFGTAFTRNSSYGQQNLNKLNGYHHLRVKFIQNELYIYAQKNGNPIEVYKVTPVVNTTVTPAYYSAVLTRVDIIQNTDTFVNGFFGDSKLIYGHDGYTNNPLVKPMPPIQSYTINQYMNGNDDYLFNNSREHPYLTDPMFDYKTNSFARLKYEVNGSNQFITGVFYNPATNSYNKVTQNYSTPFDGTGTYYEIYNGVSTFSNGSFLNYYQTQQNGRTKEVSIYKMNRNGTSLLYKMNSPNYNDSSKWIGTLKPVQDDKGYTYILYSIVTYSNSNYTVQYYLATNKSGSFVTTPFNLPGTSAYFYDYGGTTEAFISNGYLLFAASSSNPLRYFAMDLSNVAAAPIEKFIPATPPNMKISNMAYESGNLYVSGTYTYSGSNGNGTYYMDVFLTNITPNHRITGAKNFIMDAYHLYLLGNGKLSRFNKATMALEDTSDTGIGKGYPLKARGKVMTYSYDGTTASIKVTNAIDLGQNDPNFINTIGAQGIKQIFVGTRGTIEDAVNPLIQENEGYLIDYTMDAASSITNVANTIFDDLKNNSTSINGNLYYLLGDTLNLKGLYADYESDPIKASSWNVTIDPSMFDNNQGTIATSGQDAANPPTLFDHVGKYTVKVKGQDDPTKGIAALSPFSKWSNPAPLTFYVHRLPIAHFNYKLRDDPANAAQALFTYVEDSYDLDHSVTLSSSTKGIVTKSWRWKLSSDLTWKNGIPPGVLAKNSDYIVSLIVTDLEGAESAPFTVTFNTGTTSPNQLPTAVITDPTGTTAANPSIFSSLKPLYQWSYADADGDPQRKYWFYVYDSSNNLVIESNEILSANKTYLQPTSLSQNVVYSVQVKVHDGFGYGALSAKKYFKIITNLPPTGNLTFAIPIYQHDTPAFSVTQSDPNGDVLNTVVDISFNGGSYLNIAHWSSVPSGTSRTFNYGPLAQGSYALRLTVDDGKGGVFTKVYPFMAQPLTFNSAVTHTANWESHRLRWNNTFPSNQRASNVFWAGEAFVLSSNVTNTGTSSTKPVYVSATLVESGDSVNLSSVDQIYYNAEMLNTNFIHSLTDGLYTMRFQVQWSNGMIQTTDVPFQVKGNLFDVLVVQLRN